MTHRASWTVNKLVIVASAISDRISSEQEINSKPMEGYLVR